MTSVPLEELDDAALLAAHVAGDAAAFGVLFTRHRERLWAVALRTMGNPEDAADGLQDALVAAFRRAGSFRGEAQVTTWLHRVVVNACLDRLRAAKVRRAEALPEDLEDRGLTLVGPAGTDASPDDGDPALASVRRERRDQVVAALRTLPPEQRAALVLVDLEGHSVAEAAAVLECAEGTVKSRCSRGRARLAPLLAPLMQSEDVGDPAPAAGNRPAGGHVGSATPPRGPPAG
ncbi:RNA polymerase sigma factor SigM [Nocardioides nanhaiensis]|uniref:RNA polymerase sigma factor SigM n=1 Tax=Nocardioides nanhaiensis TaxID=1476871 RepID=A0ABP8VQ79_9ACTN